jgi:hypothetical protein
MSSTTSYRLSGIALIIGAVLSAIGLILSAFDSGTDLQSLISPLTMIFSLFTIFGSLLVLLGLPGMYTRQAERAGILGLLGFLFVWYVTLFQGVMISFTNVTFIPLLAAHQVAPSVVVGTPPSTWTPFFIVSLVGQVFGILLLGIATLRARVFPRWIGWLLIATVVLGVVSHAPFIPEALQSLSAIIASVAIAGFGYSLLWPERLERSQPAPASVEAEMRA